MVVQSSDLTEVLDKHRDALQALTNVVGTGIGAADEGLVIQVFVESKPKAVLGVFEQAKTILGKDVPLAVIASPTPEAQEVSEPIEFTGVTIQESGQIPVPPGIRLNAMTDPDNPVCTFEIVSFAATETEARAQLNDFLTKLIASIQPK